MTRRRDLVEYLARPPAPPDHGVCLRSGGRTRAKEPIGSRSSKQKPAKTSRRDRERSPTEPSAEADLAGLGLPSAEDLEVCHFGPEETSMRPSPPMRTRETQPWQTPKNYSTASGATPCPAAQPSTGGFGSGSFRWKARVRMAPFMRATVTDTFHRGRGRLLALLLGVLPMARSQGPDTDRGEAMRGLAELPWRPFAFRESRWIAWSVLANGRLLGTYIDGETRVPVGRSRAPVAEAGLAGARRACVSWPTRRRVATTSSLREDAVMSEFLSSMELSPTARAVATQVREECLRSSNRFGPAFFPEHLQLVTRLALTLAPRLGADPKVLALAGPLHDLAAARDFSTLPHHAHLSARLAPDILAAHGVDPPLARSVARCIETHSTPVRMDEGTPEEVCLSNADVLSHLARPLYWCFYLFQIRGLDYAQGLAWLGARCGSAWEALTPAAREMGAADRDALSRMLDAAGA